MKNRTRGWPPGSRLTCIYMHAHLYTYVHMYTHARKDELYISESHSLLLHTDKPALLNEIRVQKSLLDERLKEKSQDLMQKGRKRGCPWSPLHPLPLPLWPIDPNGQSLLRSPQELWSTQRIGSFHESLVPCPTTAPICVCLSSASVSPPSHFPRQSAMSPVVSMP